MSAKHHPPTWRKDEAAERDAYDERTAYRDVIHRMMLWTGPMREPTCKDCGRPITAHAAVVYINSKPVERPIWTCGQRDCSCAVELLMWDETIPSASDGAEERR